MCLCICMYFGCKCENTQIGLKIDQVLGESILVTSSIDFVYGIVIIVICFSPPRCLHWLGGSWLSHSDNPRCESPQSQILTQNYIECRCSVLGNFSARADISTSYGWLWPAPASCGLVIVSGCVIIYNM